MRTLIVWCSAAVILFAGAGAGAGKLGVFEADADVGRTPKAGSTTYDAAPNVYRVTGGGANMWLKEDAFHFVYRKVSGDLELSGEVSLEGQGVEMHRKAALMVRQSLDPDAAYADIAVHGDGLTSLQYRPGAGVDTSEFRLPMKAARLISIERHGHEFTVTASDGVGKPATNGPVVVTMQDPVYVGLAICSHNAEVLETAVFAHVKLHASKPVVAFQLMTEHGREGLPLR